MSALVITVRETVRGRPELTIAAPGITVNTVLDGIDETLLGNALREVDRIATGLNPGPCEQWIAGLNHGPVAA